MSYFKIQMITSGLQRRVDYILNPLKTEDHLIARNGAIPNAEAQYWDFIRKQKSVDAKVKAFHLMHSFPIGAVTAEEAFAITKEVIDEHYKEHNYVLAVHIDKKHIHTHVVIDSLNNKTFKNRRSYFKNDIANLLTINDRICKRENIKDTVMYKADGEKAMSYFEWKSKKQKRKTGKEILHDTVSYLIDRTKDLDEFKSTLTNLGYTVYDNFLNENEIVNNKITLNLGKLYLDETEEQVRFIIPGTRGEYVAVFNKDENFKLINDKTASCDLKKDQSNYKVTTRYGKEVKWEHDKFLKFYDDKTLHGKNELTISLPGSDRAIRLSTLNEEWKRDALIDKLENNRLLFTDPLIKKINNAEKDKESFKKNKKLFEQETGIENIYNQREYTAYQRFIQYEFKRIGKTIKEIENIGKAKVETQEQKNVYADLNYDELKYYLRNELSNLEKGEKLLERLIQDEMEGLLEVSEVERDSFIKSHITVHKDNAKNIREQMQIINDKQKDKDKEKDKRKY